METGLPPPAGAPVLGDRPVVAVGLAVAPAPARAVLVVDSIVVVTDEEVVAPFGLLVAVLCPLPHAAAVSAIAASTATTPRGLRTGAPFLARSQQPDQALLHDRHNQCAVGAEDAP